MTPSSAKQKGRGFQQWVRDCILAVNPELEPDDVRSTSMGNQGEDVQLSPKARSFVPLAIECKSLARFAGYKYLEQAQSHSKGLEGPIPVVFVKQNRSAPMVMLDAEHFLHILRCGVIKGT
jgi:hypothetical protein